MQSEKYVSQKNENVAVSNKQLFQKSFIHPFRFWGGQEMRNASALYLEKKNAYDNKI